MASITERNKNVKMPKKTREEYAEDALYREVWEEVNNEKTVRFVKKYWRHMAALAIVLMIAVTGVEIGMRAHRANKIAAAINYENAIAAADVNALAAIGENGGTANADLALFQAYAIDGDIKKLEHLVEHGASRDMRDLARMHYINARGDEMSAEDVEKYLSPALTKKSPFYYSAMLTVAQKYLAGGNRDAANKWLDKIIDDSDAPAVISANAQMLR
ncbi:MAG: hypothetical protein IJ560_01950 [Alphaproteobacteria bacterium]|nr:hypothetical protein [Alphaproteobacteria bacterium]